MTIHDPKKRQVARALARAGAITAALMVAVSAWNVVAAVRHPAVAAPTAGVATVITPDDGSPGAGQPLAAGTSATPFSFFLPVGAACKGDSADGGYRVQSYFVPSTVDPATLTYDLSGPVPTGSGANFRQPLFTTTQSGFAQIQTANATDKGGPGPVVNLPAFDLEVYKEIERVPSGTYNLGIACTVGAPSEDQLDRFWNARIEIAADTADEPLGVTWTVLEPPGGSTTSSTDGSTSSTDGGSTSSTDGGSTSSTDGGSTSSTDGSTSSTDGSTSSTDDPTSSSDDLPLPPGGDQGGADLPGGGGPSGGAVSDSLGGLARTGSSISSLLVWAALLIVLGRMAYLLGQPPRVRPAHR